MFPIVAYIIVGLIFTSRTQNDSRQKLFETGKVPNPLPDGDYKGTVTFETTWKGKSFNRNEQSGINNTGNSQKYPFKTYVGKGLRDDMDVLKIDYNISENPFYFRLILDEIVELEDGTYLGKVHLRLLPGVPFTITYFRLEK